MIINQIFTYNSINRTINESIIPINHMHIPDHQSITQSHSIYQSINLSINNSITSTIYICDAISGNQSEMERVTFSVFYLVEVLIWRWTLFGWKSNLTCIINGSNLVMRNWRILKTIENKRNLFHFLAISHNQCSRLPTDSARL